jgi:hypothetical protein
VKLRTRWHGPAFDRHVRKRLHENFHEAGKLLRREIERDIAFQGSYLPPVHSRPGQPPYRQSGDLIDSIMVLPMQLAGWPLIVVGSDLKYARFLELGTAYMAPRPFFRRNLYRHASALAALCCRPI